MINKFCFVFLFIALISSCSTKDKHSPAKSNEKFLKEDLDVALWQERFENRDRDVYKNMDKIVSALDIKPGETVADVGAGTGFFLKPIFNEITSAGKLIAVDISPKFVSFLKARGTRENISNLEVIKGSTTSTNIADNSVDLVFICDTYHHFENREEMLKDLSRALKKGGRLVIVDFDLSKKDDSWVARHLDETKGDFIKEISKFFKFEKESKIGLSENFMIHFKKVERE